MVPGRKDHQVMLPGHAKPIKVTEEIFIPTGNKVTDCRVEAGSFYRAGLFFLFSQLECFFMLSQHVINFNYSASDFMVKISQGDDAVKTGIPK